MLDRITLDGVGPEGQRLWQTLSAPDKALETPSALRTAVRDHRKRIHDTPGTEAFVNLALVDRLSEACERLLSRIDDSTPEDTRRAIQAAVLYYIIDDDEASDCWSVNGLEDDRLVMNAVLAALNLETVPQSA